MPDLLTPLLQYGALGILAFCAITAVAVLWVRNSKIQDEALATERAENEKLRNEIRQLNTEIQNLLRTSEHASASMSQVIDVMRAMRNDRPT